MTVHDETISGAREFAGLPGPGSGNGLAPVVLEVDQVAKTYPTQPPVYALRRVSFSIRQGELVAIVGPSGSGKTTLLHLMGTLDRPSAGAVRLTGIDVAAMDDRQIAFLRATRIGFVFQQFFLAEHQSVLGNVADGLLYAGTRRSERRRLALQALERVGLAHRAAARPTQLSGGERQRVAIARALVNRPSLLMCDEPTGNLDTATTEELTGLLESLHRRGTTLVVITHNPAVAARAQRQIFIRDGNLTELTPGNADAARSP